MSFLTKALFSTAIFPIVAFSAFAQISEISGTARFEAENFTSSTNATISSVIYEWTIANDIAGSTGTGFIEASPNDSTSANSTTNSPQVSYTINITNPGTYHVWLRAFAETAEQSSAFVAVNSATPAPISLARYGTWEWTNSNATTTGSAPVSFNIPTAGNHTLRIWMNDSGFRLDRIILAANPNFSPVFAADFWRNQNIYQIITDRFFDGDPSNNSAGLPNFNASNGGQAHGGDFKGIERKLDYIKALGATAIWISPVLRNANGDYHGYAATNFYDTNPRMGSLAELQRLVAESNKRGILVINDVVVNHGSTWVDSADTGWPAFRYPPSGYNLKYNSGGQLYAAPFDNASITSRFGNTNLTNIFHNNGGTENWGDPTQVEFGELMSLDDFKTETPYIREKMREIWTYWINTVGFDAYRIDTVKHVEMGFWDDWSPAIRAAAQAADRPNFFQFGEVFDGSDSKVGSYTGTKSSGVFKMESVLDYPLYYQIGSVFATATGNTGQIENRYTNLTAANYDASALDSLVLNIDNHDNPRFLAATGSTPARLELALAFLYTSRGIPSLYYGTEQDFNGGADPANREDMFDGLYEQGPSLGDNFNMASARFKLVARLNNLRRLYPSLRTGTHNNLWANFSGPGLLAYARRLGNEEVYVVINTATTAQTIGARPTIHPAGTVLLNAMNPSETVTVTSGVDGIPSMSIPATSFKIFIAQSQWKNPNPVVNTISPAHDSSGISPASTISITFSQSMSANATQAAFSTTPASVGAYSWSANNTVLTYTPSSNLAGNSTYIVKIDSSGLDSQGTAFHAPFESQFRTGAASSLARPSVNSFSASAVTDSTASLSATVTPNGLSTNVNFEYGTTTSYGTSTATQSIGSGNSPVTATANLNGLAPGTEYHYRVIATNSQGTTFGPDGTFTTGTPLPQPNTGGATFVTPNSANLNGSVNPNGLSTSIWFEYGVLADNLTSNTTAEDAGNGTAPIDKWAAISGLEPDTTYFFRMVAKSGANEVRGSVQSFHTIAIKPTIASSSSANTDPTAATLSAEVNPNGFATTVYFEYGTNQAYGSSTTAAAIGSGNQTVPLSQPITGLQAGAAYYFRAVAQNANGITYGPERTFTTGYPPPSVSTGTAIATSNSANLTATVNPNGPSEAVYWFEYGTTPSYGSSTLAGASDDAEGYATFSYSTTSASATVSTNGGTGFGRFTSFVQTSSSRGGIRLVTSSSANGTGGRQIDSAQSFGIFSGTSTTRGTHSGHRSLTTPRQFGEVLLSARFDISIAVGFTGMNLKSAPGTSFGANELLSFGVMPFNGAIGGNNSIVVTDASGQRNLDLGAEIRGAILDFDINFDTKAGTYNLAVKFRQDSTFRTLSGSLKASGANLNLTTIGYINGNTVGRLDQTLIFDSLRIQSPLLAGTGQTPLPVSTPVASLTANTTYYYRAVASNSVGITTGSEATFFTGTVSNSAPVVSSIPTQTTTPGTATAAIPFTVSDAQTAASALTVNASSSNKTLVPDANLILGGSGANRTITATPSANLSGNSTITVTVSDGTLNTSSTFLLIVNTPPTISPIANQTISEDSSTPALDFTVTDPETPSPAVTAASSNPALVPNSSLVLGGSGANRTITATPAANAFGNATITINATDGTSTSTRSFLLTVTPVNDAPSISDTTNQSTPGNTSLGPIAFTVSDPDADTLTVTASSNDQTLVPNSNLAVGGTGANRTITITPAANQSGTANITLTVSDGALTAIDSFNLTVGAVNGSPTISQIADQTTFRSTSAGPILFTIGDNETAAESLNLTASSSNQSLVPNANIAFGGNGSNRSATITPAANQLGNSTISITVSDGTFSATSTFRLTVTEPPDIALELPTGADSSSSATYGNGTFIGRNGGTGFGTWTSAATGFGGSYIGASGLSAKSLAIYAGGGSGNGFSATRPLAPALETNETFTATLGYTGVATGGEIGIRFLSGNATRLTLKFVGGGAEWILNDGGSDFGTGISWAGGNPGTPLNVSFTRHTENGYSIRITSGTQSLTGNNYTASSGIMAVDSVQFFSTAQGGGENLGFDNLERFKPLETPASANLGTARMSGNSTSSTFQIRNLGPGTLSGITVSKNGTHPSDFTVPNPAASSLAPGQKTTLTTTFAALGNGTRTATIAIASNDPDENPFLLNLSATGLNDPPSISEIAAQTTDQDTPTAAIPFTLSDNETSAASLTVNATSSKQTLVPDSNLLLGGSGTNRTLTITPAPGLGGTANITLTVSDGDLSTTRTFALTVHATSNATTFDSWASTVGLAGGNATRTADPDNDGWSNIQEFAFGLDPQTPGGNPISINPDVTSGFKVTFIGRTGIAYTVKTSTDLASGFNGTASPVESPDTTNLPSPAHKRFEATLPADPGRGFLKIEASVP
ncbi:MAG: Ig-like domain-containing protein [Verrucomicrobia bacterium]|nr:Ig-like domain-containing protein [Verrucomicrobiota bacterium]